MSNEQVLIATLASVCALLLVTTLSYRWASLRAKTATTRPPPYAKGTTPHVCLIVGLGGAGKTSLIEQLTGDKRARSDVRTMDFLVYKTELFHRQRGWFGRIKKVDRCTLYITDYNGQRFDQFFGSLFRAQTTAEFPIRYGYIDSVVFIADIYPPPDTPGAPPKTQMTDLNQRVNTNLQFFSTSTVDAVLGLTDRSLKCVCLFINKADLLTKGGPLTETHRMEIEARFKPVIAYLNKYSEGRVVTTLVGSAQTGMGVEQLRDKLIDVVIRPPPGTMRQGSR